MSTKHKQLIIANWKMNPRSVGEAKTLFLAVKKEAAKVPGVQVVIAPPAPYIAELRKLSVGKRIKLAAQDAFWEKGGAYTGETSPDMLKSLGVEYVILGHSERRALGETDAEIAKKVQATIAAGLTAVVCVGEHERDHGGRYLGVVEDQIAHALKGVSRAKLGRVIIAYEPVWAISTTKNAHPATADDVHEMSLFIQKILTDRYSRTIAANVPVLYGGSVTAKNIESFASRGEVSGYLVGGVSLKAKEFGTVVRTIYGTTPRA